jgi:hypothetical protein
VVHAHLAGSDILAPHTHPPGLMLHIYLNDAEPVQFNHDGPPYSITRPPVKARSYRIGIATPETHAVVNMSPGPSDYLRIELKTQGSASPRRRIPAPPLGTATASEVEETNAQFRATRITLAADETMEIAADAEPALFIALTEGASIDSAGTVGPTMKLGKERFIEAGHREMIRNLGSGPVQLLRVDFLTRPM